MGKITLDKVRRYMALKADHARKRFMFLRKPLSIAMHPGRWMNRRRPHASMALAADRRAVLENLRGAGFSLANSLVDQTCIDQIQRLVDRRLKDGVSARTNNISARKNFWDPILERTDLASDSALVRLALSPGVIDLATAYLGHMPYLTSLELVVSRRVPGQDWRVSQLWHRDFNDSRMVKLFVYFSDVHSDAEGPFTFMPASALRGGMGPMFPIHKNDEAIDRIVPLSAQQSVTGPKGTAFLIDTHRCFHCGSRVAEDRHRVAYIATFTTCDSYYRYDNGIALSGALSTDHRLVLRV